MIYTKINTPGSGLTNQVFSVVSTIIKAYQEGHKVVVFDHFLNEIHKPEYTPFSDIFDIKAINVFLKKEVDIVIVDKYDASFHCVSATYGTNEVNIVLTDYINENYIHNRTLRIPKTVCFNDMLYDPCPNIYKTFTLRYTINEYYVEETYPENLANDIVIDFDSPYECIFGWINSYNVDMFEKILTNITYHSTFIEKAQSVIREITHPNVNVIHLRMEDDGITHWSNMNGMSKSQYASILENIYIRLITTHFSPDDKIILLTYSLSNGVVDFLNENGYNYTTVPKFFGYREKDAIVDLLVSRCCNNIFIGNFNVYNLNGSTFSYYVGKLIKPDVVKIFIDPDNITSTPTIVQPTGYAT
jgi:hypothetical protein